MGRIIATTSVLFYGSTVVTAALGPRVQHLPIPQGENCFGIVEVCGAGTAWDDVSTTCLGASCSEACGDGTTWDDAAENCLGVSCAEVCSNKTTWDGVACGNLASWNGTSNLCAAPPVETLCLTGAVRLPPTVDPTATGTLSYYVIELGTALLIDAGTDLPSRSHLSGWPDPSVRALSFEAGPTLSSIGAYTFTVPGTGDWPSILSVSLENVGVVNNFAFKNAASVVDLDIGSTVTNIGQASFENVFTRDENVDITLTIPGQISLIQVQSFQENPRVTQLIINEGVVTIGEKAFYHLASLSGTLAIPDSVTSIGANAFFNCPKIEAYTFGPDSQLTTIGAEAFAYDRLVTSFVLPPLVTHIGRRAFYYNLALPSFVITDNVTYLGPELFLGASVPLLETFTLPDNFAVNLVGSDTTWAKGLKVHTLYPATQEALSYFKEHGGLCSVTPNPTNGFPCGIYDGVLVVTDNTQCATRTSLEAYVESTVPVTADTTKLQSITGLRFDPAVTIIGPDAFKTLTNLQTVTIGENVETIKNSAFYNLNSIVKLIWGTSLVTIESNAFSFAFDQQVEFCVTATSCLVNKLTIPSSVEIVTGFTGLPPSVLTLDFGAGSALDTIGTYAFMESHITFADLSNAPSLRRINNQAFYKCLVLGQVEFAADGIFGTYLTSPVDFIIGNNVFRQTSVTVMHFPTAAASANMVIGDYFLGYPQNGKPTDITPCNADLHLAVVGENGCLESLCGCTTTT
jgi:hypothetical protein